MKILNGAEQMLFDRPPQLSSAERRRVFELPVTIWSAANEIQSVPTKIGFLVSAGYFRSARRFFLTSDFHDRDIAYVAARLGIKNLKKQNLYMFRSRRGGDRAGWAIKPEQYVDPDAIINAWDDVLRLVATIRLKESTASDIFRRLNSYSRQHSLYTALKSFGRIIKSMFILRYIDDVELRMAIENLLNRIELGNRFTRAIAVGNPREFSDGDKEEQEIAEACNRLIKNAIVCWNYLLLEHRLNQASTDELRAEIRAAVANHSVISWGHINLLGEYDFSDEKLRDSVGIPPPKIVLKSQGQMGGRKFA